MRPSLPALQTFVYMIHIRSATANYAWYSLSSAAINGNWLPPRNGHELVVFMCFSMLQTLLLIGNVSLSHDVAISEILTYSCRNIENTPRNTGSMDEHLSYPSIHLPFRFYTFAHEINAIFPLFRGVNFASNRLTAHK